MTSIVFVFSTLVGGLAGAGQPTAIHAADHVHIIVPGVEVVDAVASARGDRIEVPTLAGPDERLKVRIRDKTAKTIRIYGGSHPRVSIQLRHGRTATRRLASVTRVEYTDGTLHIYIPRDWRAALAARRNSVRIALPGTSRSQKASQPVSDDIVVAKASDELEMTDQPQPVAGLAAETGAPVVDTTRDDNPTGSLGATVAIALLLILGGGGALWYKRKSKTVDEFDCAISVVATRQLGAKTRVVLLATGGREVLLSVGDKGPRLLAQWRTRSSKKATSEPVLHANLTAPAPHIPTMSAPAASPAVAGLIRLRDRMPEVATTPTISPEVATDDAVADAEWARELLAATTRSGRAA